MNILAYLLFTLRVSESVGGGARHRACVLILTGAAMSHEKHGLLWATVLQFAYKLMKKEAFLKLSCARVYRSISVYIIAEAGLLLNVDELSLSLPEWESSVEKPRRRRESLRKYQLQGEKLAKTSVVLLFGLYMATSSVVGECLGTMQECSLGAPLGDREDAFMPFAQRDDRCTKAPSDLTEITRVYISVRKQTQVS